MIMARSELRRRRQIRVRKRITGSAERPRLSIFRSNKHLYAQAIDDHRRKTLFSFSTANQKFKKAFAKGGNIEAARKLGEVFGKELLAKKIKKVVMDRGRCQYHGRLKALAESLREAGLDF